MDASDHIIRLGLIGDNIAASQAPRLHRLAGRQNGRTVSYRRLVPAELGQTLEEILRDCASDGFRGVNITYPYKERAAALVGIEDPVVRAMGAVNTVLFDAPGRRGFNTDHSGFVRAWRQVMGRRGPGSVLVIGSGGVGRAVAFGLVSLGATEIRLVDRDPDRAEALARALRAAGRNTAIIVGTDAEAAAAGAAGVVNCTPVGMVGHDGTPLAASAMKSARWAFDAVYTPTDTRFLRDAAEAGLRVIGGYELFIGQGIDAWRLFTGLPLDEARLRQELAAGDDTV